MAACQVIANNVLFLNSGVEQKFILYLEIPCGWFCSSVLFVYVFV